MFLIVNLIIIIKAYSLIAQLARAPALHAGGHRFDSDILHNPILAFPKGRNRFFVLPFGGAGRGKTFIDILRIYKNTRVNCFRLVLGQVESNDLRVK